MINFSSNQSQVSFSSLKSFDVKMMLKKNPVVADDLKKFIKNSENFKDFTEKYDVKPTINQHPFVFQGKNLIFTVLEFFVSEKPKNFGEKIANIFNHSDDKKWHLRYSGSGVNAEKSVESFKEMFGKFSPSAFEKHLGYLKEGKKVVSNGMWLDNEVYQRLLEHSFKKIKNLINEKKAQEFINNHKEVSFSKFE